MAASEWELQQQLSTILPLGESEVQQVITQASSLPSSEASEYLSSLLGDSPDALKFITAFGEHRAKMGTGEGALATDTKQTMDFPPKDAVKPKAMIGSNGISEKNATANPPAYAPPGYAPPSSAPPARGTSRAQARHHTNQVIEAGKLRARDEVC